MKICRFFGKSHFPKTQYVFQMMLCALADVISLSQGHARITARCLALAARIAITRAFTDT